MARSPQQRVAVYDDRYRELAAQLAEIGPISAGSLTRRYTRCTSPGCRCNADPPQPHGPYWQLTRKVGGKTTTRRLTADQADLYREWIANDRQLRRIIDEMRTVAAKANEIRLTHPEVNHKLWGCADRCRAIADSG
jgi:alkanesulfonate monooxygenase SsuD/methylene tetrahydromethanopterin reductase-like flavin-dependent oxidoreductase (luciferase family)